jgi:hypothetical protein
MSDDRTLQDWGGYQPETQKALRFVKQVAGEGTAKQVANAIAQEYAKREEAKPVAKKRVQKLSKNELRVLGLLSSESLYRRNIYNDDPEREFENCCRYLGLSAEQFSECLDVLVEKKYLVGDALMGYTRTKKPIPVIDWHKALTEEDFEMIVDDWIAAHPYARIDEKQRQLMIRSHMAIQKTSPGWTL